MVVIVAHKRTRLVRAICRRKYIATTWLFFCLFLEAEPHAAPPNSTHATDPQLAHVGAMAFFMYEEAALDHSALVECVPGWMYHDQAAEVAMHRQLQVHPSLLENLHWLSASAEFEE